MNHVYSDLATTAPEKGIILDLHPKKKQKARAAPKAQKPARPLEDASFRHLCAIQELRREATKESKRIRNHSLARKRRKKPLTRDRQLLPFCLPPEALYPSAATPEEGTPEDAAAALGLADVAPAAPRRATAATKRAALTAALEGTDGAEGDCANHWARRTKATAEGKRLALLPALLKAQVDLPADKTAKRAKLKKLACRALQATACREIPEQKQTLKRE